MYLTETNLLDLTRRQFTFKFKAYLGSLISLITVQVLAILFSFNGVGQMGMGGNAVSLSVKTYSGNLILFFSIFWAFIVAITFTTKPYRYMDFSFVTNRISSHLSTIALLILYSVIASITSMLGGNFLRVMMYFKFKGENIFGNYFFLPLSEVILGVYIGTLYVLLFAIIGYTIGMFVQLNKLFGVIIPALLIGWIMYDQKRLDTFSAYTFFVEEQSIFFFTIKILITVGLLITLVVTITNRMEVRK